MTATNGTATDGARTNATVDGTIDGGAPISIAMDGGPPSPVSVPPRALPTWLVPGNPGNAGGKKGRSGRKPTWFTEQCSKLSDAQVLKKVRRVLHDREPAMENGEKDEAWWAAAHFVAKYSKREPAKAVALEQTEPFVIRVVRE